MLGKLLVTPVNLLLLDEPTNHLDMESCDALLAAIDNFDGVVIMVTHNEMFLHALAERLIVFQNNGISVFDGTYQNFLEKGGWEDESSKHMKPSESAQKNTAEEEGLSKLTKKEMRRRRSEIISERGKVLKPVEQRITRAEDDIERYEKEMVLLNEAMQTASQAQDGTKIVEISQSIHVCQAAIDKLFDDLETFTNTLEGQHAIFEKKLQQLEDFRTE